MNNQQHTAKVGKPENDKKVISGQFTYTDGKLDFTCSTANVSFTEVEQALIALRNEVQRQLDNKHLCRFMNLKNAMRSMATSKKTIQPEVCSPDVLIKAIRESFIGSEQVYTQGSCIMFFRILKRVYPEAVPYWSKKANHMITSIGDKFYDITGEVKHTPDYETDDKEEYSFISIAVALPKDKTRKWCPTTLIKMTDL